MVGRTKLEGQNHDNNDLGLLNADQLVHLISSKNTSYSVKEMAFDAICKIPSDEIGDDLLQRLARNAPQKYRDWANNELEIRRELSTYESSRKNRTIPKREAIISSYSKYDQWDIWKSDPFNLGLFFTFDDYMQILKRARSQENRNEALRRIEERNRCEKAMSSVASDPRSNDVLLNCPAPYYWNTVATLGLPPYRERAAEKLFQLVKGLPDSERTRNVYERALQSGTQVLKDRAATALISLGIQRLGITSLRYIMFYARGELRQRAIAELRSREVTDPEQRKRISADISKCSRIPAENICANAASSIPSAEK